MEIKETLGPATSTSVEIPFAVSAVMGAIYSLEVDARDSMLFLSKSWRESKVVNPSYVIWVTPTLKLNLMLLADLDQVLEDTVTIGGMITI